MDKTVKIGVDSTDVKNIQSSLRQSSEQLARDMIRQSRQYSTSAKEVLKDIEDQIKAIEKRNKLDSDFRRSRLESLHERGAITDTQFMSQRAQIGRESREDQLQTRLLRELIDTVRQTSKDEIRENRRDVEKRVSTSKTVGVLGISGDELDALKETLQQDILGTTKVEELRQKSSFNLSRGFSDTSNLGQSFSQGNIVGMLPFLSRVMTNPAMLATLPFALIGGGVAAGMSSTDQLRSYMMASQINAHGILQDRVNKGGIFPKIGLETEEGMNLYGNIFRATGGARLSQNELLTLASITRSRDISPELLNQTVGFQRYSTTGSSTSVVVAFEQALKRLYPDEFRRKLVQLPEMMGVYNSLAQQMLQTTGSVNSQAMSNFVAGVSGGFGVEGVNLQRYAGGIMRGFTGSQNNFLRKMQFHAIRQAYGDVGYQRSLEILENPTENVDYMRMMERNMRGLGLTPYRSWMQSMGFGAKESREAFESGDFESMFQTMKSGENKTLPTQSETLSKYFSEAQGFQNDIKTTLGEIKDLLKTEGVRIAADIDYFTSGDFEKDFKGLTGLQKAAIASSLFGKIGP